MSMSATRAGITVGRYRLDELLSTGGMGEVWRAFDTTLGRQVAVKLLAAGINDAADHERFVREARAAAQLNHPNVVAIFDVGEWSGRPYLVMELLDGHTLAEELHARGPLPVAEVRDLAAQAASALNAAHANGVVHRDIKPSNLFRTRDGVLKVVDFGIARVLDEASTRLTRTGTVVGTAAYLAPEQARGWSADARTDLYSLGCVIYQLLCGRTPFTGGVTEVIYGHLHTPPKPPSRLRPDVPADLEALVLALLAKEPDERPSDAIQVRAALLAGSEARTVVTRLPAGAGMSAPGDHVSAGPGPKAPGQGGPGQHGVARPDAAPPDVTRPLTVNIGTGDIGTGNIGTTTGEGRRRSWVPWAVAVLVLAGVVALAAMLPTFRELVTPSAGETTRPPSSAARTATPAQTRTPDPTPTPTSTPTPVQSTTPPPEVPEVGTYAWVQRMDAALALLAASGADQDVVEDLRDRLADALEAYDQGRERRARKEVVKLLRDLRKAHEKGDLEVTGPLQELFDIGPEDLEDGEGSGNRAGEGDDGDGPPGQRRRGRD